MNIYTKDWNNGAGWGKNKNEKYSKVLYKRAKGELPEMESSKATAKIISGWINEGDSILDVGCGVGHYLKSIKNRITCNFFYTGIDNSSLYIRLAKKVFSGLKRVAFYRGNIYQLPFKNKSFEIVMSNNVLLHLPSIEKPLRELCRVSRRHVLIRTLIGERSFRIKEVRGMGDEFKKDGSPKSFNYYNIYSKAYIDHMLSRLPGIRKWEIIADNDFDPKSISKDFKRGSLQNTTKMIGDWQVNGYILQPWAFIKINL
ncbi:MAG: class I SAM-dependent methyltransferase [Candidatus Omnitrophota bacterium]